MLCVSRGEYDPIVIKLPNRLVSVEGVKSTLSTPSSISGIRLLYPQLGPKGHGQESVYKMKKGTSCFERYPFLWLRQESNLDLELRKLLYYPLYDEAKCTILVVRLHCS